MEIAALAKGLYRLIRYGKQIGKTAANGSKVYEKVKNKEQKIYTIFDKHGKISSKTAVWESPCEGNQKFKQLLRYDAKGNKLSSIDQTREINYTSNGPIYNCTTHHKTFNKMGQTINDQYRICRYDPLHNQANLYSRINGVVSKRQIITKD